MKIFHVVTRFKKAGTEENTLLTCNAQVKAGHSVTLIHGIESSNEALAKLSPEIRCIAEKMLVREVDIFRDLRALWSLASRFKSEQPDVVHTHTSKAGIIGRLAAAIAGVPVILHGIHILPFVNVGPAKKHFFLALERIVENFTHGFISVSEEMRDISLKNRVGNSSKYYIVESGMDLQRFRNAAPVSDAEFEHTTGRRRAGSDLLVLVSSLEARKRQAQLLPVFLEVLKHRPRTVLLMLGEGEERSKIEAKIRELDLADSVFLLGHREDVERWIAAADICLLASEREGLPRVIVQYLACGKSIVATRLPGIDRLVIHGENGMLVPVNDLMSMADCVIRILSNRALRRRFEHKSSRSDLSAWEASKMIERIERIYQYHHSTRMDLVENSR